MNQSDPLQAKPRATLQQKVLGYLCLALFVIACLPMLGLKFGFPFHPSVTWVIQSKPYAWALAAIFSIGGSLLFAKGFLKQNPGGLSPKFWLLLLSCFPFFGLLGMQTVSAGFPMVAAMITGSDVELSYTVTNQKSTNGRHCHNPIDIADMPFMFDKICNFPSNVRENLKIGDTVVLKGRGTKFGLFPHQIEYH